MDLATEIGALLGTSGWLVDTDDTAPYTRDWLDRYGVAPLGVARPGSTAEVAGVMRLCHAAGTAVVPQGGRTGLVGASVSEAPGSVILSLSRLNQIDQIDPDGFTATVGAGLVLSQLHDALEQQDLEFPLHLGAEGSAQIGGLVATNAGGSHAFRYGTMIDQVLGLEVVLPNGDVWDGMRRLLKDNAGFQLRKLFCGAEGRLGIVTRAVVKLHPAPKSRLTTMLALPDLSNLLKIGRSLRSTTGDFLTALEFFDDGILDLALHHVPDLQFPMETRAPFYLLCELATTSDGVDLDDVLERALTPGFESGQIADAVLAQSHSQRAALWRIREDLPEGTLREGRQLKHDISVPVARFPDFLTTCAPRVDAILPGTRIWTFGHLGDGNIHYNLSPPAGMGDFGGHDSALNHAIYACAEEHDGSFAAEHGIGRSKLPIANALRTSTERALMARLHAAIDPENIMNPGVVV